MISVIICSKSKDLLQKVTKSIADTIGVEHEIIVIENSNAKIGICEAYNKGASQAKFNYLCFSHEDVIYHTQDWGKKLIAHLSKPEVGVIGVVGCIIKPQSPSGVWLNNGSVDRLSMIQTDTKGRPYPICANPHNEQAAEVKTLDGLFLCCRKAVWEQNKFDQERLKDFHGYDVDFSLQVGQSFRNYVVYDIQIQHFSYGRNTPAWVDSVIEIEKKWASVLPSFTQGFDIRSLNAIEHYSLGFFLRSVIENKLPPKKYVAYYLKMVKRRPFKKENFRLLRLYWQMRRTTVGSN